MKIAFFTETYPPYINGVATQTEMLTRTFRDLGHQVMVVTVGSEKLDNVEIKDNIIYVPGFLLKKIYNYRITLPVKKHKLQALLDFQPDVIHVQNEFGIGETGMKISKEFNIPLVYTLHSEYDRFLFYVGLKYFETFSKKLSDSYLKRIPKYADVVTSPSPKAQVYMARQGIDKKVVVVDNTVENNLFELTQEKIDFRKNFRDQYGLDESSLAFVFVGRIGQEKNILELVDNFIYADLPSDKAKLFIIGKGPESETIENKIADNNLNEKIIYIGPRPNTEIPKYLYAMDYYTTASLSEMHSISMLEGMASGLPCLIKLDRPNKHQITPGVNGYQWDSREDFKELFTKIVNLDKEEAQKLKESTLKYIEENDNYSQAKKLIEIYKQAIEIRKNR